MRSDRASLQGILEDARRAYDAGRPGDLARILRPGLELVEHRKDEPEAARVLASAWALLALGAERTGQYEDIAEKGAAKAAAMFDELHKQGVAFSPDELNDAVAAYYLARRGADAVEWARRAGKAARPETHLFQGLAEHDLGHHESAVAALTQAQDVKGPDLQLRRLEALIASREALGGRRPEETAADQYELGRLYYSVDRYREALAALDRSLALVPRNAAALAFKAEALRLQNDRTLFDQALAAIQEALRLQPDYAWGHAVHGSALAALNKFEAAEAAFKKAISLDANVADWHYRLGDVLRQLDRLDEALQSLDRSLELAANRGDTHSRRGETLRRLNRLDEALAALNRALELNPDDAFALASKGETLKRLGKAHWPEAEQALQRAVELSPSGYPFAETSLADLWLDRGREADALAGFDRVLKNSPDYVWALEGKAQALIKLDKFETGLGVTRRLLELDPKSGWAHAVAGVFLFMTGDYPGSARELQLGIDLNPKIDWAQEAACEAYTWLARFSSGEAATSLLERALVAGRKAVELSAADLSYRTTLANVLWLLGGVHRAEAEAEYQRVLKDAQATERLEFYPAAGAGLSALRLASRATGEEARPLLGEAERFFLEALAIRSERPGSAESITAKLNLGLLMLCSERFALGLREYDAAIALAVQQQELRVRQGLLRRASQLLKEARTEWPRLQQSPHVEKTLSKLQSASEAPVAASSR